MSSNLFGEKKSGILGKDRNTGRGCRGYRQLIICQLKTLEKMATSSETALDIQDNASFKVSPLTAQQRVEIKLHFP